MATERTILTTSKAWLIASSLRIAADQYTYDACVCAIPRVASQFEKQAKEALELAELFESAIVTIEEC